MWCLEQFFPNWRELAIHESSPVARGASAKLQRQAKHYLPTQYYPGFPAGQVHPSGFRCEDLQRQTFPDAAFDLVVTQDVMEHVLDPGRVFAEIARTLRSGRAHVFTVPLVNKGNLSRVRAQRDEAGALVHLALAQYHGNPVDELGSLVTTDWGYDIADNIFKHSGLFTTIVHVDDLSKGIRTSILRC